MAADGISIINWLQMMAFGGIAGSLGQMVRVVAGLKKMAEEADAKGETMSENMDNGRLIRSLMIGAVAGILAAASTVGFIVSGAVTVIEPITREAFLGIVAAGYAGTDFIEAFMTKNLKAVVKTPAIQAAETEAGAQAAAAKVSADKAAAAAAVAAQAASVTPPVTDESVG